MQLSCFKWAQVKKLPGFQAQCRRFAAMQYLESKAFASELAHSMYPKTSKGHVEVGLNYRSQNAGNLCRDPCYSRNHKKRDPHHSHLRTISV